MNYVLICAGGKGKRMNHEKNKVFMKIKDKEIIARTLEVFEKAEEINGIIISTSLEDFAEMEKIIAREGFKKIEAIVEGGKERQDSVYNGLKKLKEIAEKDDVILIHNAANPFVEEKTIKKCIKEAKEFGAAVAAQKVKDTIKKVNEELIVKETLDRNELWQMQTPQAILFHIALKAFEKAYSENFYGTDDVQLVERIHGKVKIVECSYENIKITTKEDIELAEKIIEKRKSG
jgi:2-C-methyl-D-erythritol 4-phosphate cytidylyltransferase